MIQSPVDLAELLAAAVRPGTAGEAISSAPAKIAFVSPPRAVFTVRTVEGQHYRVTVEDET